LKVLLTLEDHLTLRPDDHFYVNGPAQYSAWSELLSVFDEVVVIARAKKEDGDIGVQKRIDGPAISIYPLPDWTGPWQYLQNLPSLKTHARRIVAACEAYLLRVPGLVGGLVWQEIRSMHKPFGVEVLGDPWDALAPGTMPGPFRTLYRQFGSHEMKKICASAATSLYWTRETLQARYPPRIVAATFVSPRIVLDEGFATPECMAQRFRRIHKLIESSLPSQAEWRIGYLGTFAQLYKGPDTLLHALSLCRQQGLNFKVLLAGEGRYRRAMEALAQELSLGDRAIFVGQLQTGRAVAEFLDTLDLFVMPSRQEGLCRAFVEAMARGCPCIGTYSGAIELLSPDDLVRTNDPGALSKTILAVTSNCERIQIMAARNLKKARQFSPDQLRQIRCAFYESLKACSQSQTHKNRVAHAL